MKDIEMREDLENLLIEFYKTATDDEQIGHHFKDLDLVSHLPVIVDFWEKILFGKHIYFGNPMRVHQILHEKFPLKFEHFQRWIEIFNRTVDTHFAGAQAENAKLRAKMIAHSLNQNLNSESVKITSKSAN
jgi:hemoglobin